MMMVMRMIDTATSLRFSAASNFCSSSTSPQEFSTIHVSSRRLLRSSISDAPWNRCRRSDGYSSTRGRAAAKNWLRASIENLGSASDPSNQNGRSQYHPSEDISESLLKDGEDARLTAQETARTIVEVNGKATLMLSDLINDDIHENIVWPDIPYVTDEHGNIYFKVKNDEDILQTLTSENNFVQAIIGFDAMEMLSEMELLESSQLDFGIEEIDDENSDNEEDEDEDSEDDDYDEDLVAVFEDDEKDDFDEVLGDWAKLDTMRSSHPMYFAKQLAQVASDDPIDGMEQPAVGLAIQGLIRPAFIEEHSNVQRRISLNQSNHADINSVEEKKKRDTEDLGVVDRQDHLSGPSKDSSNQSEESEKDRVLRSGASFYRLEMTKIQLISAHGHQTLVDVEDFKRSQPDAIAHVADKIISRLKPGGEKTTQALKSLCWRCRGIQVEEAAIIGIDSLGFDLRVCSGTQIQTLRFSFNSQATSEYSAERQLDDILHPPRIHQSASKKKQAHQNEL